MIDKPVYLATLLMTGGALPKLAFLAGAATAPLLMGLSLYRANRFLAAVGFSSLHFLFFGALAWYTGGGYPYFLYTLTAPLTGGGYADLLAPTAWDTVLVYGLPPLLHSVPVPVLGLALWRRGLRGRRG